MIWGRATVLFEKLFTFFVYPEKMTRNNSLLKVPKNSKKAQIHEI